MHSLWGFVWAMHAKPFACLSCSACAANNGIHSHKHCPQRVFGAFCYVFLRILGAQQPPKSQHHEHHGALWAPKLLLGTTHMRYQRPSKSLNKLRCPKVRNEVPIVLMMLALRLSLPDPAAEKSQTQRQRKS